MSIKVRYTAYRTDDQRPLTDEEKRIQDNHLAIITDATHGLLMTMSQTLHLRVDKVVMIMLSVIMKHVKGIYAVEEVRRLVSTRRWEIIEDVEKRFKELYVRNEVEGEES